MSYFDNLMAKLNSILCGSSWCCRNNSLFNTLSTTQPVIHMSRDNDQIIFILLGSNLAMVTPFSANPSNIGEWN